MDFFSKTTGKCLRSLINQRFQRFSKTTGPVEKTTEFAKKGHFLNFSAPIEKRPFLAIFVSKTTGIFKNDRNFQKRPGKISILFPLSIYAFSGNLLNNLVNVHLCIEPFVYSLGMKTIKILLNEFVDCLNCVFYLCNICFACHFSFLLSKI